MPVASPPKPTDFVGCLNHHSLHLRLNQRAEKHLREVMGVSRPYLDPMAEQQARNHANPLVRQAFREWQDSERRLAEADELLSAATAIRNGAKLDALFQNLDC